MLQVVAAYDYQAQRSDELSFMRGDVITVLHKDNDNWWMGELPDGQQGYFPVTYVVTGEIVLKGCSVILHVFHHQECSNPSPFKHKIVYNH